MKMVVIGCSHGRHAQLIVPQGDVLVHTGDFSRRGDESDAISFLKWFEAQPHEHKVFVAGNHDGFTQQNPQTFAHLVNQHAPSCHYLHEKAVEIGGLKWFGSNWTPEFCNWYWMSERGPDMMAHWDKIPDDTQVLITHGPARDHLDLIIPSIFNEFASHEGCDDLKATIDGRLKDLKLSCFSHLHYQGCQQETVNGITYVNASVVDDGYSIRGDIQVIQL